MVFGAVATFFGTVIGLIQSVMDKAPKPVQIMIFLFIGLSLLGLVSNWIFASDYVCTEENLYEADSITWAFNAKLKDLAPRITDNFIAEATESGGAQQDIFQSSGEFDNIIIDVDGTSVTISEFGTYIGLNKRMDDKNEDFPDNSIVIASPLAMVDIRKDDAVVPISTFYDYQKHIFYGSGFSRNEGSDGKRVLSGRTWICQRAVSEGEITVAEAAKYAAYGDVKENECYMTNRQGSSPCGADNSLAEVTLAFVQLTNLGGSDPGDYSFMADWGAGVTMESTCGLVCKSSRGLWNAFIKLYNFFRTGTNNDISEVPEINLDLCQGQDLPKAIDLKNPSTQWIFANTGVFQSENVDAGEYEQIDVFSANVKAKYVAFDKEGLSSLLFDEFDARGRQGYVEDNIQHYKLAEFEESDMTKFQCDDDRNVEMLIYGLPIFSVRVLMLIMFFVAIIVFLRWVVF